MAQKELDTAKNLSSDDKSVNNEIIKLEEIKSKPVRLLQEFTYWQKISSFGPNYRDAFLQKAILNYQLKRAQDAKADLKRALDLDPNYEDSLRVEKIIGGIQ